MGSCMAFCMVMSMVCGVCFNMCMCVSMVYKNWFDVSPGNPGTLSDEILDALNDLVGSIGSVLGALFD